jgi:hypothetical protein
MAAVACPLRGPVSAFVWTSGVKLLRAAQLGRLVSLHRAARERGAVLQLVHFGPLLLEEFEAARLTRVFDIASASVGY